MQVEQHVNVGRNESSIVHVLAVGACWSQPFQMTILEQGETVLPFQSSTKAYFRREPFAGGKSKTESLTLGKYL